MLCCCCCKMCFSIVLVAFTVLAYPQQHVFRWLPAKAIKGRGIKQICYWTERMRAEKSIRIYATKSRPNLAYSTREKREVSWVREPPDAKSLNGGVNWFMPFLRFYNSQGLLGRGRINYYPWQSRAETRHLQRLLWPFPCLKLLWVIRSALKVAIGVSRRFLCAKIVGMACCFYGQCGLAFSTFIVGWSQFFKSLLLLWTNYSF